MMVLSAFIGATSSFLGLLLSYYLNMPSGPAIVLVETGIFLLVFLFAPRRGLAWTPPRRQGNANPS